jgi:SAM-dependent methyltransferase
VTSHRADWESRHRDKLPGDPEPFVLEALPLAPRGLALDVAAGLGRHSLVLARAGMKVVAIDYSVTGLKILSRLARAEHLPIHAVAADLGDFPLKPQCYDAIINVSFLDRRLFPAFANALRIGGVLIFDSYHIDQAKIGHPRNPEYLLKQNELRELLGGLEVLRYREGPVTRRDGALEYRASAVARRRP